MLQSITAYVARYAQVIATVTGINVEVVDNKLLRIAGTGMYATGVGESIERAGEVYRHVLANCATFVMHQPRTHEICKNCDTLADCCETFSICTPILYHGRAAGIIGMVCFTERERNRMLENLEVYQDFVEQIANAISAMLSEQWKARRTKNFLDMLLQITDNDNRGIVIFSDEGVISYINEMARKILGLTEDDDLHSVQLRRVGSGIHDMDEFEISIGEQQIILMGSMSDFNNDDPLFHQALVFDSMPQYAKLLAQLAHSSEEHGLQGIIGESRVVKQLKQQILQIADTSSTVLITGESGTGKEMVARAIHAASDRHDKPFIPINCGAIPDALLESELFGYVSGAFTGANPSGYIGKFELAHQGVVFLDEIGAMPLYLQVKLLRVLQDRRIMRLGSNRVIEVDVRIIAATNEQLPELIEQRMFRDDLYYRLNVIPLMIPPLRERPEDIPDLATFFLDKYCKLFSKKNIRPSTSLLRALSSYNWPGNVREFENVMEYLVNIIPDGGSVGAGSLPQKIRNAAQSKIIKYDTYQEKVPRLTPSLPEVDESSLQTLVELEKKAIIQALAVFGDTLEGKQKAADSLGIGIATLYRKIRQYGE